jgi:hypothetical protein
MLKMIIRIPVGCTAVVKIPAGTMSYMVNGENKTLPEIETLESGQYIINCRLNNN